MFKTSSLTLAALALTAALSGVAQADTLVDRGLPSANLNATDASRSNVAWVDGGQTAANPTPGNYWLEGDTFSNTSANAWNISTIRVWVVGAMDTVSLVGGPSSAGAGGLSMISSSYTTGATTYPGGASYTTQSGNTLGLTQVDFAVNLMLGAGETYSFFLNGTGGSYVVPFMSASNAGLSGSTQDGADGLIWEANFVGGAGVSQDSFSTAQFGWDKASDFNVQVIGNAVPEPGSVALVGVGLLGAAFARRRRAAKAA